jgi:radical S-adenosyl methionine domain-containing protein 2
MAISELQNNRVLLPTLNLHLIERCNMTCRFCFAKYRTKWSECLSVGDAKKIIEQAAGLGIEKINFAGGEPLLYPYLTDLIFHTSELGLLTSVVTNGSLLTKNWINQHKTALNCIGLSIDSIDTKINLAAGRAVKGKYPITELVYRHVGDWIHTSGIGLKINTVASQYNLSVDLNDFLLALNPQRWKVFQALSLEGVNSRKSGSFVISTDQFNEFIQNHEKVTKRIPTCIEDNRLMTSSYLMMDPKGRLYDNTYGRLCYSDPVPSIGLKAALNQVNWSVDRFKERSIPFAT